MPPAPSPSDARLDAALAGTMRGLDGLRGVAIALVLAVHFGNAWPGASGADRTLVTVLGLGWTGVDLFFVLSGLLITGILVDTLGAEGWWTGFLARRALRIFPLYYLALALFALAGPALGFVDPWTFGRWGWWYWSYLGNWAYPARQGIPALSHFWSLAVEEQFYLAWPLVVLLARGRRLAVASAALVAAGPLVRWAIVHAGWPVGSAYRVTPGRVDELALGALLAVALRTRAWRPLVRRAWAPTAALGAIAFLVVGAACNRFDMHHPALEVWSHSLLAIAFGGLVAGAVVTEGGRHPLQRILRARALQALGRYSYGLYVIHFFVHDGALRALRGRAWGAAGLATRGGYVAYAAAGIAASVLLAAASHHGFEKRFLALKSRFAARRARTGVPEASL